MRHTPPHHLIILIIMAKKLTKSYNKTFSGVCAGIAEYFDFDPTLVRIAYAFLTLFSAGFPGVILYIIMAIVMPGPEAR